MIEPLRRRIADVDAQMELASVSLARLTDQERDTVAEYSSFIGIPHGTLLRRAEAIRLAGGQDNFTDCLREAVGQIILLRSRSSDPPPQLPQ